MKTINTQYKFSLYENLLSVEKPDRVIDWKNRSKWPPYSGVKWPGFPVETDHPIPDQSDHSIPEQSDHLK